MTTMPAPRRRAARRRSGRPTNAEIATLDQDILEAALRHFLDTGYEGTSLVDIAATAHTTKRSMYARFPSKEELFRATLTWAVHRTDWPYVDPPLPATDELEAALRAVADATVRRALDPQVVALARLAVAQAGRLPLDLARHANPEGWPRQRFVADLLRQHAATGAIQVDDPEDLAAKFLGLIGTVPARLALVGIMREPADQQASTESDVRFFLRALRPDPATTPD